MVYDWQNEEVVTIPRWVFEDLASLWLGSRDRRKPMAPTNHWLHRQFMTELEQL
jgi:hypothetical protein